MKSKVILLISVFFLIALVSGCGNNAGSSTVLGGPPPPPGGGGTPGGAPATISGAAWKDLNQNTVIDSGEPGIPGVTIDLNFDSNGNGSFDLTDEFTATTTTDSNGNYSFKVTKTGRYFVSVIVDNPAVAGLLLTTNSDEPTLDRPLIAILRVDITDLNFGKQNLNFGFVSPTKWSFDISPNSGNIVSSPAIAADGTLYVGGNSSLYAINSQGILKWQYKTGDTIIASPAVASDGTIYVGSADRQFYAINPDGSLKWIYPTKTVFTSSAAVGSDGTIYAAGTNLDKTIFSCVSDSSCFSPIAQPCVADASCPPGDICVAGAGPNGSTVCAQPNDVACGQGFAACPTGETCVFGHPAGFTVTVQLGALFAINPNGSKKWTLSVLSGDGGNGLALSGVVNSSPAIAADGKTIYIGSQGDFEFDRTDVCNKKSDYPESDANPSPANGGLYPVNGHLYAINTADGTTKWDFKTLGQVDSSPSIAADGTIYVGSRRSLKFYGKDHSTLVDESSATTGFIYAINPDGTIKRKFDGTPLVVDLKGNVDSSPAVGGDGTIYIGADNFHVYALNPADLSTKWVEPTDNVVKSSPAVATDGTIYIGSNDGSLYAFNSNGAQKSRFPVAGPVNSSPNVGSDGTVYFVGGGALYAIIGDSLLANTPWPKFRHDLLNTGRK